MEKNRQNNAAKHAEAILRAFAVASAPVDPFDLAAREGRRLRVITQDLGERFDGQLEYHQREECFLLFVNTKYDRGRGDTRHAPRTRFSAGHELGHYHLDAHRELLLRGGPSHASRAEFEVDVGIEREADAFSAALLMPSFLMSPRVNASPELTKRRVEALATAFETSLLSTAIRAVTLSQFPWAAAGIRDGTIAWTFFADSLIQGGCYPSKKLRSASARDAWSAFEQGAGEGKNDVKVGEWFEVFGREHLLDLFVTEEFLPIPSMETLVVLLTMDEDDLFTDES